MQKTKDAIWFIWIAGVDLDEKIYVVGLETASAASSFHGIRARSAAVPNLEQFCLNH
jgi:hypothetical protein